MTGLLSPLRLARIAETHAAVEPECDLVAHWHRADLLGHVAAQENLLLVERTRAEESERRLTEALARIEALEAECNETTGKWQRSLQRLEEELTWHAHLERRVVVLETVADEFKRCIAEWEVRLPVLTDEHRARLARSRARALEAMLGCGDPELEPEPK